MITTALRVTDSRVSTSLMATPYLGACGRWMFSASRSEVHRQIRQGLRVADSDAERRRVTECWRRIHYLGDPDRAARTPHWDPIGQRVIRLAYYLDLPALRPHPVPWWPAAAVTVRYSLVGAARKVGLASPLEALEIARVFVADDTRVLPDFTPELVREVVRRTRAQADWQATVAGRVKWQPKWLLSMSDPAQGHDGGLYRGAGAAYLGRLRQGKDLWGWRL